MVYYDKINSFVLNLQQIQLLYNSVTRLKKFIVTYDLVVQHIVAKCRKCASRLNCQEPE